MTTLKQHLAAAKRVNLDKISLEDLKTRFLDLIAAAEQGVATYDEEIKALRGVAKSAHEAISVEVVKERLEAALMDKFTAEIHIRALEQTLAQMQSELEDLRQQSLRVPLRTGGVTAAPTWGVEPGDMAVMGAGPMFGAASDDAAEAAPNLFERLRTLSAEIADKDAKLQATETVNADLKKRLSAVGGDSVSLKTQDIFASFAENIEKAQQKNKSGFDIADVEVEVKGVVGHDGEDMNMSFTPGSLPTEDTVTTVKFKLNRAPKIKVVE